MMKKRKTTSNSDVRKKRIDPDDIRAWLDEQTHGALVETIMQQAMTDDEFYNVLKFKVAAESPADNTGEMRAVIRQAMVIDDFVSWRETSSYSAGVERYQALAKYAAKAEAWPEAEKGGCSNALWLQLAREREKDHPADAVAIYRRQVEPLLEQKNNHSYHEAVDFLGKTHMKELLQEMKQQAKELSITEAM